MFYFTVRQNDNGNREVEVRVEKNEDNFLDRLRDFFWDARESVPDQIPLKALLGNFNPEMSWAFASICNRLGLVKDVHIRTPYGDEFNPFLVIVFSSPRQQIIRESMGLSENLMFGPNGQTLPTAT